MTLHLVKYSVVNSTHLMLPLLLPLGAGGDVVLS